MLWGWRCALHAQRRQMCWQTPFAACLQILLDQVPRRRDDRRDKTASKMLLAQQRVILHCYKLA